jgi:hypothetical protein
MEILMAAEMVYWKVVLLEIARAVLRAVVKVLQKVGKWVV